MISPGDVKAKDVDGEGQITDGSRSEERSVGQERTTRGRTRWWTEQ